MRRKIPGVLWVALIALGVFSVIQFLVGIGRANVAILVGVAVNLLLLWGLYRGHRWAFVLTLVFGVLGIVASLGHGAGVALGTLIGDALVLVPMILAKEYFWGPRRPAPVRAANYCGRCGHSVEGVLDAHCPSCGNEMRRADEAIMR